MSDEQTPDDVIVEGDVQDAPVEATDAEAPHTPKAFTRGRRGKRRAAAMPESAPDDATPDAGIDSRIDTDADVVTDDAAAGPDGGEIESAEAAVGDTDASGRIEGEAEAAGEADAGMSVAAFEAISGELKDPELFDPAEVANAPRAPHPLKPVVEALIFASPEPLTLKAMARLLDDQPREDIEIALAEVRESYLRSDGLQLVEVAGGFQIVTRPELYEWVRRLFKERTSSKLSVQALETLAVIAYKQPVTSGEIAEIRGVSATTGVLNTLLDRKLVKIVGRKQVVGRPFMYGTTREFLDKFGLRDLADLPKVEDMSEALGFDLPSPVDEGDGVSLPFDDSTPVEPLLFEEEELKAAADALAAGAPMPAPVNRVGEPESAIAEAREDEAPAADGARDDAGDAPVAGDAAGDESDDVIAEAVPPDEER